MKHNLKRGVKKVWKTRGTIPAIYLRDKAPAKKTSARDADAQRIIEILNRDEIASTKFRGLGLRASDIARGKSTLTEQEVLDFKAELVEIRNKLRRAIDVPTTTNMKTALTDVRLHPTKAVNRNLYRKITGDRDLLRDEKEEIKFALVALNNFLKI